MRIILIKEERHCCGIRLYFSWKIYLSTLHSNLGKTLSTVSKGNEVNGCWRVGSYSKSLWIVAPLEPPTRSFIFCQLTEVGGVSLTIYTIFKNAVVHFPTASKAKLEQT